MPKIPNMNLPREATPWGNSVEQRLSELSGSAFRREQGEGNTNKSQSATIRVLQEQVAGLNVLFNNLVQQVNDAINANSMTTAGILAAIASPGNVNSSGTITANVGRFDGGLFSIAAYATIISGTRVANWTQNDGTIGTAPSSARFKTNVVDAGLVERAQAILALGMKHYNYLAEIAKRDDPTSPDYVGPNYKVHLEVGVIAEELHAAGLWEFVVYERDDDGNLTLSNGQPVPFGVHYELLGMAAIAASQYLYSLYQAQQTQIDDMEARLTKAGL